MANTWTSGGVVPARVKGMASADALQCAPEAGPDAVRADGIDGILGARGCEPAGIRRQQGSNEYLIGPQEGNDS